MEIVYDLEQNWEVLFTLYALRLMEGMRSAATARVSKKVKERKSEGGEKGP